MVKFDISLNDISLNDIWTLGGGSLPRNNTIDMNQLTDSAYYIVAALLEARHGYSIMKYIEDITDGAVSIGPATLYTLIKKLQTAGLIELLIDGNDRRKTYQTTTKGKEVFKNEIERRRKMVTHGDMAFRGIEGDEIDER